MRVLVVSDYSSPTGGAEAVSRILVNGLRERGHEVRLFASTAGQAGESTDVDYTCYGTTAPWRTLLQTANPFAARSLKQAIDEFRPDVVHVRMFLTQLSPLILPVLRSVPSLYHAVWYRAVCPLGTKLLPNGRACEETPGRACRVNGCLPLRDWLPLMFQRRLQKKWLGAFDAVIANSEATSLKLAADGIQADQVIPNGVPPRIPSPPLSDPMKILFAGRLVPEKGAHVLLRAFARLITEHPIARLVIAGEGPQLETLEHLAAELALGQSVVFPGHLSTEEVDLERAQSWVQVAPSVWDEPFGIVAAEAMMSSTAVIASNSGGLRDIVRPGVTGLLVPPDDAQALATALIELASDREQTQSMGEKGRQIALSEFSDTILVERFLEVYRGLIGGMN